MTETLALIDELGIAAARCATLPSALASKRCSFIGTCSREELLDAVVERIVNERTDDPDVSQSVEDRDWEQYLKELARGVHRYVPPFPSRGIDGYARVVNDHSVTIDNPSATQRSKHAQIVLVVRAQLVSRVKELLLMHRQARHHSAGQSPRSECRRWVHEVNPFGVALSSHPIGIEPDGMDVHPPLAARCDLYPDRKPVRLHDVAEAVQGGHATVLINSVYRKVEISVSSGLDSDEDVHAPSPGHPVTGCSSFQCVEDLDAVAPQHCATLRTASAATREVVPD